MKLRLFLFIFAFSCFFISEAREKNDSLVLRAAINNILLPEERVFLHFDNSGYYLGETMWFKAYVTSGVDNRATTISKVLYVELVAPEGYVIETKKYKIKDGACDGEFTLKPELLSGYYEIRAYTRYMLNRGDDAIFSRVFPVYDKVNGDNYDFRNMLDRKRAYYKNGEWVENEYPEVGIEFYPEGGHLVHGIESSVAYELRGGEGEVADDSIFVYAGKELIAATAPVHEGIGSFRIKPDKNVKYKAVVRKGKKKHDFKLPEVEETGVVISVENKKDTFNFTLRHNLVDTLPLTLLVLHRGEPAFYSTFQSSEASEKYFSVAAKNLRMGVNRVVAVVGDTVPLAERQFFVTHDSLLSGDPVHHPLTVAINGKVPEDIVPQPHEKLTVTLARADGQPLSATGSYSVSVYDGANRISTSYSGDIYSHLLLSSEIKGYIPDVERYFDAKNSNRTAELDLLMLTRGWTSYDWSMLPLLDENILRHPIEKGILLKGRFVRKDKSKKLGKAGLYTLYNIPDADVRFEISYKDSLKTSYDFNTDKNGWFKVIAKDFYGKRIASLNPTLRGDQVDHKDSIYAFSLDRYFSPTFRMFDYWERTPGRPLDKADSSYYKLRPFEYQLTQVEVTESKGFELRSRPPRSELRLDFLDEWEYAQDVTFLEKSLEYNEVEDRLAELYKERNLAEDEVFDVEDDKGGLTVKRKNEEKLDNSPMAGIMTAADILRSAFWRHNYTWCYWMQAVVVKGEYNKDAVPMFDEDYIKGVDPEKMLSFKEFVIRTDAPIREKFENTMTFWYRRGMNYATKHRLNYQYGQFYDAFLSYYYIMPRGGEIVDDFPGVDVFVDRGEPASSAFFATSEDDLNVCEKKFESLYPRHPNYVACFIPYTEKERASMLVPELHLKTAKRYTVLQGYSESKKFYSPDYSGQRPDGKKDVRRTLHWATQPTVNADGNIEIELYNSSIGKNLQVDVNGVSGNEFFTTSLRKADAPVANSVANDGTLFVRSDEDSANALRDGILSSYGDKLTTLGINYHEKGDYKNAFERFARGTAYGYAPAMYYMGVYYMNGYGVEPDESAAYKCFLKATEKGDLMATDALATCFFNGYGVEKNLSEAFKYYNLAAEKGYTKSQVTIGNMYSKGTGVERDSEKAYYWYNLAAEQGEPSALYRVAEYYSARDSVAGKKALKNSPAFDYYKRAAEGGNAQAQLYLSRCYQTGRYVKKNKKEAFQWALRAADGGLVQAQEYVANCYLKGRGVSKNPFFAYEWYKKAAAQGSKVATERTTEYETFRQFVY
ncbi:MAG: sel1 repeat family protein [Bacteroidaceae bacterium]|nr:sel1 repeat family protein [Bacteroidaceae bacterium]